MIALCVDDEAPLLADLVRAVEASPDIEQVVSFRLCSDALSWAGENRPDIAFLDIQLRGMNGLELARRLKELHEDLPVVFCTGYREYAFDAIQLHAAGYLVKPVRTEDIQREIDHLKKQQGGNALLTVQCFGNFEVFSGGKPIRFKRKRSKELLAYLVDRRGSTVSAKEICTVLWEDDTDTEKHLMLLYKLFGDLREAMIAVGAEEVLIKGNREYGVNTELIECDYYRFLSGDPLAAKRFAGEYMLQYPWAEETAGWICDNLGIYPS